MPFPLINYLLSKDRKDRGKGFNCFVQFQYKYRFIGRYIHSVNVQHSYSVFTPRLSELLVCVRDLQLGEPLPRPPSLYEQLGDELDHYHLAKSYFDLKEYDRYHVSTDLMYYAIASCSWVSF